MRTTGGYLEPDALVTLGEIISLTGQQMIKYADKMQAFSHIEETKK